MYDAFVLFLFTMLTLDFTENDNDSVDVRLPGKWYVFIIVKTVNKNANDDLPVSSLESCYLLAFSYANPMN